MRVRPYPLVVALFLTSLPITSTPAAPPVPTPAPAAEALPPPAELRRLVGAGQYRDALRPLLRVLSLKGKAADPYDRHEVQMLRAECLLQLGQTPQALAALDQAYAEADKDQNPRDAAEALALAHLLRSSPGGKYKPKVAADKTPLTVMDRAARRAALEALLADELPVIEGERTRAESLVTLAPLLEVGKRFAAVRAVERVVTGDTRKADALADGLTRAAAGMLGRTLGGFDAAVTRIAKAANRPVGGRRNGRRVGLTREDAQMLRDVVATCDKIPGAVTDLTHAFARPVPVLDKATRAENVRARAHQVLTADYGR